MNFQMQIQDFKATDKYGDEINCSEDILIETEINGEQKMVKHIVLLQGIEETLVALQNDERFPFNPQSKDLRDIPKEKITRLYQEE